MTLPVVPSPGITEPARWPEDGGKRRAAVLDHDSRPPRVIRHVGWRTCLRCRKPFWSEDVLKVRLCSPCKGAGAAM